jgi:hypothetical protein
LLKRLVRSSDEPCIEASVLVPKESYDFSLRAIKPASNSEQTFPLLASMLFIKASSLEGREMRRQYLHLCIYRCDNCEGPVVTGSLAVRENEISEKSEIRELGAMCLSCGKKPGKPTDLHVSRCIPPVPWGQTSAKDAFMLQPHLLST